MEPLKNIFSRPLIEPFAAEVRAVWPQFDADRFLLLVFDADWESRELKQRVRHISHALRAVLPPHYPDAVRIVEKTAEQYVVRHGEKLTFDYTFLPDFVEAYGADWSDESIAALETITQWSSAEFAVRPLLLRYPERMFAQMLAWSQHPSPMVRRLSSEGIRPRLPWGMGVPTLKRDPAPILPILENLRNDPAETVRRSVANNLNDIAKDWPALVLDIASRWLGHSPETDWVVRHACRGLLKKGNADALAHFGFQQGLRGVEVSALTVPPQMPLGGRLHFSFWVKNTAARDNPTPSPSPTGRGGVAADAATRDISSPLPVGEGPGVGSLPAQIRLEYAIDYQTLSGKTSTKVFKIKELKLEAGASEYIVRHQGFQDFTTRKHYPGPHRLRIVLNGQAVAEAAFEVL